MSIHWIGKWNAGNQSRAVYRYDHQEHEHRMGSCDWLPNDGDLCVCVQPSGDYFDDYVAMRQREDGMYEKVGEFGAYAFGEPCARLEKRDFYLLLAGEPISYS